MNEKIPNPFNKENKSKENLKFINNESSSINIKNILKNKDIINKELGILIKKRDETKNLRDIHIKKLQKLIIENIDYKYRFNLFQILRINLLNEYIYNDFKVFNELLIKLILLLKKILKLKINIYRSIFETHNNFNNNSKTIQNNLLTLINGTKLNEKEYTSVKNKKIIMKLKKLMDIYHNLNKKYNKSYDENVMIIQKKITKLLLELE